MLKKPGLSIGDLAKATDIQVGTIRWYEHVGLLLALPRTAGNYRSYGSEHLNRLSFIRRSRDLGFSIGDIRALLALSDERDRDWARLMASPDITSPRSSARSPI